MRSGLVSPPLSSALPLNGHQHKGDPMMASIRLMHEGNFPHLLVLGSRGDSLEDWDTRDKDD